MAAMMTVTDPGDKVDRFLPVLRKLRRGHHSVGRRADLCAARSRRISIFTRPSCEACVPPAPQGADPLQPLQSLRQGVHARGAGIYRDARGKVRYLCHHRRGLRAHRLRAAQAYLLRDPAGHVGAHAVVLVAVQDLLDHRLASRLHHRAAEHHRPSRKRCTIS